MLVKSHRDVNPADLRKRVLDWVESLRVKGGAYGAYRGSSEGSVPAGMYQSCYAALLRYYYRDLDRLSSSQRKEWVDHISGYQDPGSGWFNDPAIPFFRTGKRGVEEYFHQTSFADVALESLGARPRHPVRFLSMSGQEHTTWLESLSWMNDPWMASVWLMMSTLLKVRRLEVEGAGPEAQRTWLDVVFAWLDRHQDPRTGFWSTDRGASLYQAFGAAFHHWVLYEQFDRPMQHLEKSIDNTLLMQRRDGHCGRGSGQTDYDLAFGLYFLAKRSDYRKEEMLAAAARLLDAQFQVWNDDGGFYALEEYEYFNTAAWFPKPCESDLVATYFRTKCLLYASTLPLEGNPLQPLFRGVDLRYR